MIAAPRSASFYHPPVAAPDSRSDEGLPRLITQDAAMEWVMHLAARVALTELPVLITGETGTGKELFANLIHAHSRRAGGPFVALNCPAIPPSLLESELFGYQRGAFTGADRDRLGVFAIAAGGTVFLDEVSEIPLEAQPKLLRVIQEGEIWPLGAARPHRIDVRIIAATNRDLEVDVRNGRFREDLYYRLSVFPITVPPLRHRRGDLPRLVEHFATVYARRCMVPRPDVSTDVLELLASYAFPGNVRELENLIARAVVLTDGALVLRPDSFPALSVARTVKRTFREEVRRFKAEVVSEAVRREQSMGGAARALGMSSRNLNKLCGRLGLAGLLGPKGSRRGDVPVIAQSPCDGVAFGDASLS